MPKCLECSSEIASHYLEIQKDRWLCPECAFESNEGYIVETGEISTCKICLQQTKAGEEYIIDGNNKSVCNDCLDILSEKVKIVFICNSC